MQRVTITIDDELAAAIDRFMQRRHYANRSEAMRDLARGGLQQVEQDEMSQGRCIGALVYTFDHDARELPKRLVRDFHEHHDLAQATLHMHLDHERCLEVTVLQGEGRKVQALADHIIAERGIRHGRLVCMPYPGEETGHGAPHRHEHHGHTHAHRGARRTKPAAAARAPRASRKSK